MPIDVSFTDTQRMDGITVAPTQRDGVTPAQIQEGSLVVETLGGGDIVGEVVDGKINIISGALAGPQQIQVRADADLSDEGVSTISDFINVNIVGTGDRAVNLGLSPGVIREK
jgi:hypothetical protein